MSLVPHSWFDTLLGDKCRKCGVFKTPETKLFCDPLVEIDRLRAIVAVNDERLATLNDEKNAAWTKMKRERDAAHAEISRLFDELKELQEAHTRSHEVAADLRDEVALLSDLLEQVFTEATRTTHSIPDALVSTVVARLNIKPSEAE